MKDRFVKTLQGQRKNEYTLHSRTPSDLMDAERNLLPPPSQEEDDIAVFDRNYQYNAKNITSGVKQLGPEMNVIDEVAYKEELMLLQSGNYVMSAPSLAVRRQSRDFQDTLQIDEEREEVSKGAYKEEYQLLETGDYVLTAPSLAGGGNVGSRYSDGIRDEPLDEPLIRGQTKSVDEEEDMGIEKTYTTYVNVAEDKIYPLEWKFFLEATSDANDGNQLATRKKTKKAPRSSSALRTILPSIPNPSNTTPFDAVTAKEQSPKTEEKDSESLNSGETKRFRLFPNLRDVASRRTKRIEAARQRQKMLNGNRPQKHESTLTNSNNTTITPNRGNYSVIPATVSSAKQGNSNPSTLPTTIPVDGVELTKPKKKSFDFPPNTSSVEKLDIVGIVRATSPPPKTTPLKQDVSLQELAERILGSDMAKTEKVTYDYMKSKRTKKKKNKKLEAQEFVASTSFPVVSLKGISWESPKSAASHEEEPNKRELASMNDVSDTVTIARGVEAVYSNNDDDVQGLFLTVEKEASTPQTAEFSKKVKPRNESVRFDLSNNKIGESAPFAFSRSFDDVYHSSVVKSIKDEITPDAREEDPSNNDSKWYNFGRKSKQQTVVEKFEALQSKAAVPTDTSEQAPVEEINFVNNTNKLEENDEDLENSPPNGELDEENASTLGGASSVLNDNNNDNMSVMTEHSDKIVSNFFDSFGQLLSLFGRRFKRAVTCTPNKVEAVTVADLVENKENDISSGPPRIENDNVRALERKEEIAHRMIADEDNRCELENAVTTTTELPTVSMNKQKSLSAIVATELEKKTDEAAIQPPEQPAPLIVTMSTAHSKGSSISMTSQASTKTFETDNTEDSYDEYDDENVTATSSWDDGGERRWFCACAK